MEIPWNGEAAEIGKFVIPRAFGSKFVCSGAKGFPPKVGQNLFHYGNPLEWRSCRNSCRSKFEHFVCSSSHHLNLYAVEVVDVALLYRREYDRHRPSARPFTSPQMPLAEQYKPHVPRLFCCKGAPYYFIALPS
jgi:hypothetical protein